MLEDIVFKINEATRKNLSVLSDELCAVREQRALELCDVAEGGAEYISSFANLGLNPTDAISQLFFGLKFIEEENGYKAALGLSREVVLSWAANASNLDKAAFSELLNNSLKKRGVVIKESDFLTPQSFENTFTYVRNPLSDEAYDVFTEDIDGAKVTYSENLRECVKRVVLGEVSFCLLPLEEKGGTRIGAVTELILGNDLKINAVTPVFGFDGNAGMKYAMVSRGFSLPQSSDGDDRYIEILIEDCDSVALLDFLSAAVSFGHSIYRVNTQIFDKGNEEKTYYSVILRCGGQDLVSLLIYLTIFSDGYRPIGIFKNLE